MLELITRLWHLHFRLILSTALGTAVTLALLAVPWRAPTRILLGWDAGVVLYLALIYGSWQRLDREDPAKSSYR